MINSGFEIRNASEKDIDQILEITNSAFAAYKELAKTPAEGHVFISHADALEDAELLADMLFEQNGVKVELITDIGAVIGAHAGPGTIALFFTGKAR